LELKAIHARLKERFAEAVGEWPEPEAGDGWIEVQPDSLRPVAEFLRQDPALAFDYLRLVTGVDRVDWMEAVYHLHSYAHDHQAILKVKLDRADPAVASLADLWPAADWHERETFDLLGIRFDGHPNLRRILLPEDWQGHPLRKDYKQPDEYHGISNW